MDCRVKANFWYPARLGGKQVVAGFPKSHIDHQIRSLIARQMSCCDNSANWVEYSADDVEFVTFATRKGRGQSVELHILLMDDFCERERNMIDRLMAIRTALQNLTGLPESRIKVEHHVLPRRRRSLLAVA